jgi:hypothetical protein
MSSSLYVRVIVLVPLVVAVLLWASHHLGIGPGNLAGLGSLVSIVTFTLGAVEKLLEKAEVETIGGRVRETARMVFSMPVLVILYIVAGVVGLTASSVMIIPDATASSAPVAVRLAPVDRLSAERTVTLEPGSILRMLVFTNPFGRPFRLHVDGYVPETFDVYPLTGLRVRPGRELRRSPSLLIRVPVEAKRISLDNEGQIVVWVLTARGREEIARDKTPRGAFLLGRPQPVPSANAATWRLELLAAGLDDGRLTAETLVGWSRPKVLQPRLMLEPGMTLRAEVINRAGATVAWTEVTLGNESLTDVGMEEEQ